MIQKQIEMTVRAHDRYFPCQVLHMNERGVLARLLSGKPDELCEGEEGICLLNDGDKDFEGTCQVLRIVRNVVALTFSNLDILQQSFVQKLAEQFNKMTSSDAGQPQIMTISYR